MNSERVQTGLLMALLIGVGVAAWAYQLRPALEVDASALATLPQELDGWSGVDMPLEETVEKILRADYNLQRTYLHPVGGLVWFYIGYYGTDRGGRSDHTPEVCYKSAGWLVVDGSSRVLDLAAGLRVNEMLVEREGHRRLVLYWFQSHRDTGLVSALDQTLDRLVGRLLDGRADGAFVRLSTPLADDDETTARSRLMSFATRIDPAIAALWPVEHPVGEAPTNGVPSTAMLSDR